MHPIDEVEDNVSRIDEHVEIVDHDPDNTSDDDHIWCNISEISVENDIAPSSCVINVPPIEGEKISNQDVSRICPVKEKKSVT